MVTVLSLWEYKDGKGSLYGIVLEKVGVPNSGPTFEKRFMYLDSENSDPFIYLPFRITTYTYTSMVHRTTSRKE